jgi:hypothetical protein
MSASSLRKGFILHLDKYIICFKLIKIYLFLLSLNAVKEDGARFLMVYATFMYLQFYLLHLQTDLFSVLSPYQQLKTLGEAIVNCLLLTKKTGTVEVGPLTLFPILVLIKWLRSTGGWMNFAQDLINIFCDN